MNIILGPSHDLHAGIHGTLRENAPAGITYMEAPYEIVFDVDETSLRSFSPLRQPCLGEQVRFIGTSCAQLIHSARLPVTGPLPFVVDADCLLLPLQTGAFLAHGIHAGLAHMPDETAVRRRENAMLRRYAGSGCGGIILRTAKARRDLLFIAARHGGQLTEMIDSRTIVVHPTLPARSLRRNHTGKPLILFMGRTFEDKGGPLALDVFSALRTSLGDAFEAAIVSHRAGPWPERATALGVAWHDTMSRAAYLDWCRSGDVLWPGNGACRRNLPERDRGDPRLERPIHSRPHPPLYRGAHPTCAEPAAARGYAQRGSWTGAEGCPLA